MISVSVFTYIQPFGISDTYEPASPVAENFNGTDWINPASEPSCANLILKVPSTATAVSGVVWPARVAGTSPPIVAPAELLLSNPAVSNNLSALSLQTFTHGYFALVAALCKYSFKSSFVTGDVIGNNPNDTAAF